MENNRDDNVFYRMRMSLNQGKGIPIAELSRRIGVSASRISGLELGRREPTKEQLLAYHKYFDIPIEVFLTSKEPKSVSIPTVSNFMELPENDRYREITKVLYNTVFGKYILDNLGVILMDDKANKRIAQTKLKEIFDFCETGAYRNMTNIEILLTMEDIMSDL